jgi:iron complex outermembrane receptor protein
MCWVSTRSATVSKAILHQPSGEYRGEFFDEKLTVNVGIRAPFFLRKLHNYCFTSSASGFVECTGRDPVRDALIALKNPYTVDPITGQVLSGFSPPQARRFTYDKLLPNIGAIYDITNQLSAFASYSKGLSVPSTDNLYNSFFFAPDTDQAKPKPELTDSFDGGVRYRSSKIQAQASVWYTSSMIARRRRSIRSLTSRCPQSGDCHQVVSMARSPIIRSGN